jgi:hypothetical protein
MVQLPSNLIINHMLTLTSSIALCSRFGMNARIFRGSSTRIHVQSIRRRTTLMTVLDTSALRYLPTILLLPYFGPNQNYHRCFSNFGCVQIYIDASVTFSAPLSDPIMPADRKPCPHS